MTSKPHLKIVSIVLLATVTGCNWSDRVHYANEISPGLTYISQLYEIGRLETVHADLQKVECRIVWKDESNKPFQTISALENFGFATNGGIYEPGLIPAGLYIEHGEVQTPLNLDIGSGNFYLKPNGVFLIEGSKAIIVDATEYDADAMNADYAIQSGPLLVVDGEIHPAFNIDSENRYIRSGVGVQSASRIVFALSKNPVTFHEFATLFRDDLGCANALYLDGAISTFAYRDGPTPAQPSPYATMITLSERKD